MAEEIIVQFPAEAQPVEVIFPAQPEIVVQFSGAPPAQTSPVITLTAGADIGGHRGVSVGPDGLGMYADKGSAPDCIGVSAGAAVDGAALAVQTSGEMTESSWSWNPGEPVYLGDNGLLTQTPTTTGNLVVIGTATGEKRLLINIEQPIQL